jgi:hypothetical protein
MVIFYYILEFAVVYVAIAGTWEIAQATVAKGLLSDVHQKIKSEEDYHPFSALKPLNVVRMFSWWFGWKATEVGVSDAVILKKRFSWGLRYLMASIVLAYVLEKVKLLFF